jgi:hypothetical protein
MNVTRPLTFGALAALAVPSLTAGDESHDHRAVAQGPLVGLVREATKLFRDPNYALAMGYVPGPCVSGAGAGAMGVHFVNESLVDAAAPDVDRPEAIIYEPVLGGGYRLVGVEYITLAGPAVLEGHLLQYVGAPNRYGLPGFYELHVWAWRDNPGGTFADFNTRVTCDAQPKS